MNTGKQCGSIGERWRISLASLQGPSPLPMENFASDPAAEQGNPLEEATNTLCQASCQASDLFVRRCPRPCRALSKPGQQSASSMEEAAGEQRDDGERR